MLNGLPEQSDFRCHAFTRLIDKALSLNWINLADPAHAALPYFYIADMAARNGVIEDFSLSKHTTENYVEKVRRPCRDPGAQIRVNEGKTSDFEVIRSSHEGLWRMHTHLMKGYLPSHRNDGMSGFMDYCM